MGKYNQERVNLSWKDILKATVTDSKGNQMVISEAYDITGSENRSDLWDKESQGMIPIDKNNPHDSMGCQMWSPDGKQYYCLVHNVRIENITE